MAAERGQVCQMQIPCVDFAAGKIAPHRRGDHRETMIDRERLIPRDVDFTARVAAGPVAVDKNAANRVEAGRYPQTSGANIRGIIVESPLSSRSNRIQDGRRHENERDNGKVSATQVSFSGRDVLMRECRTTYSKSCADFVFGT